MKATKETPIALFHEGGPMFAGDETEYPFGWYLLDERRVAPLTFSEDSVTLAALGLYGRED